MELWVFPRGRRALCLNKTLPGTASHHVAKRLCPPLRGVPRDMSMSVLYCFRGLHRKETLS